MKNRIHPLADWIPYKLIDKDGLLFFEWIYLGDKRFTDPFFDDTIAICRSHAYNSSRYKVLTTAQNALEWSAQIKSTSLRGLLLHVSRCGSTMISQLLAIPASNIVLSEVPVIDQLIRNEVIDIETKKDLLYAVIRLLGHKRFPEEHYVIFKLDAWHLLKQEQIRKIFPDVPFFILYRNPAEVLKSHVHLRGMHMVPGTLPLSFFDLNNVFVAELSLNQFGAYVLEKYYQAIFNCLAKDQNILVADYDEGIENIIIKLNKFLHLDISEKSTICIQQRLNQHSKNVQSSYTGDKEIILDNELTIVNKIYKQIKMFQTHV